MVFYKDSVVLEIGEQKVRFIGYEQLIKNKGTSPRAKDNIDLEELKKNNS